jgi:hypothetical protein
MPYCIDPDYSFLHRVCQPYRVSAQVRMDRLCRAGPSHTKLAFASTNDLDRDSWDPTIRAPKGMGGASAPRLPHHASWVSRLPLWAQQGLARRTLPDSLAACAGGLPAHALLLASAPYTTRLEQDVVIAGGERHRARAPIPVRTVKPRHLKGREVPVFSTMCASPVYSIVDGYPRRERVPCGVSCENLFFSLLRLQSRLPFRLHASRSHGGCREEGSSLLSIFFQTN